jgi:hypothetical protein
MQIGGSICLQYGNLETLGLRTGCLLSHNPLYTFVYQLIHLINYQMEAYRVWALPDSLATTTGIVIYFLFLALLRCFSSGGYLNLSYGFRQA